MALQLLFQCDPSFPTPIQNKSPNCKLNLTGNTDEKCNPANCITKSLPPQTFYNEWHYLHSKCLILTFDHQWFLWRSLRLLHVVASGSSQMPRKFFCKTYQLNWLVTFCPINGALTFPTHTKLHTLARMTSNVPSRGFGWLKVCTVFVRSFSVIQNGLLQRFQLQQRWEKGEKS